VEYEEASLEACEYREYSTLMAHTWEDIWHAMFVRREADSYLLRQMIDVRDRYNGDVVIPVPDVDGEYGKASAAPQIIADGVDHTAMRAASVMPSISVPSLSTLSRSKEYAATRRRAIYANWHWSGIELLLYRAFRHFIGYGTTSLLAVPDFDEKRARIELRDPLTAYPELRTPEDFHDPLNVGFVFGRSGEWIRHNYPEAHDTIRKFDGDTIWELVEWIDEDDIVMGILGPRHGGYDGRGYGQHNPAGNSMQLRRWPNRAGRVPAACPRRATLNRIMGQLTHIIPSADLLDRLTALETIAAERHVFPDMVILGKRTAMPTLQGGKWKDGREGEPNVVLDADGMQLLQPSVGPATFATMERVERAARISGGVPELFGGVNGPGLRTGRALDSLGAFSIDPRVMEAQKFMSRALGTLNEGVMAIEKGYWPNKKYTVFTGFTGDTEVVEYTPRKHFESLENYVDYSLPGLDISQITVALGQLVGANLISRDSARDRHPLVRDALAESKKVVEEKIEDAVLVTFLQQASAGTLPLIDLVRINEVYQETGSIIEAVKKADREARERQAAEPPAPEAGMAMPPEAMPGLATPGQGAEAQPGPAMPPDGPGRLQAMLAALQAPPG
jgi:hypothetical protein